MISPKKYKKLTHSPINNFKLNRMKRRYKILGFVFILGNVVFIYFLYSTNISNFICNEPKIIKRKYINPPQPSQIEDEILSFYQSSTKEMLADRVSNIIQDQIRVIQSPANCTGPNIICGHYDESCGFGCQFHHRVACLMISYALNLPLIHDEVEGWSFSSKWSDLLQPLGASCTPGPNSFRWSWRGSVLSRGKPCLFKIETFDQIEYPLANGIPVSKRLADLVEIIHPNPPIWLVGQFMKYALRFKKSVTDRIEKEKRIIGFQNPVVGFHVRRTDKINEVVDSHHEIEEYASAAGLLIKNQTDDDLKRVFVASEDSEILIESRRKFPHWNVIGFPSIYTSWNAKDRVDGFYEILRDVQTLSDCDYVVCGFGSNICRLLLPIINSKHLNGMKRLRSLESAYQYVIQKHTMQSLTILKVDRFNDLDIIF